MKYFKSKYIAGTLFKLMHRHSRRQQKSRHGGTKSDELKDAKPAYQNSVEGRCSNKVTFHDTQSGEVREVGCCFTVMYMCSHINFSFWISIFIKHTHLARCEMYCTHSYEVKSSYNVLQKNQ